jgi:hypothetical protein
MVLAPWDAEDARATTQEPDIGSVNPLIQRARRRFVTTVRRHSLCHRLDRRSGSAGSGRFGEDSARYAAEQLREGRESAVVTGESGAHGCPELASEFSRVRFASRPFDVVPTAIRMRGSAARSACNPGTAARRRSSSWPPSCPAAPGPAAKHPRQGHARLAARLRRDRADYAACLEH